MLQGNLLCGLRVNSTEQLDIQDSFFEFFCRARRRAWYKNFVEKVLMTN